MDHICVFSGIIVMTLSLFLCLGVGIWSFSHDKKWEPTLPRIKGKNKKRKKRTRR